MSSSAAAPANQADAAGKRAALLLVAAAATVTLVGLFPIAAGLLAAPALAIVCRPIYRRLTRRVSTRVAALLVVALVWICLVVPGAWLASVVIQQMPSALSDVHRIADRVRAMPTPFVHANGDSLLAHVGARSEGWISSAVGPAFGAIGHATIDLSVAFLGLFFLLATENAGWEAIRRRLPFSATGSDELKDAFVDATRATLFGRISSAALQGASIGIGLRLIGSGAPAAWGAVGGFATLLPVVGNAVVWVPAVVVQLMRREYGAAIIMLVFGRLIPSLVDRGVSLSISRHVGNMHPMVTFLGVLIGVRLTGPVGVVIGPPLLQCSLTLWRLYEREYGLPWVRTVTT